MLSSSDNGAKVVVNGEEIISLSGFTGNEMINIGKRHKGEKIKLEIIPNGDIGIGAIYIYYENEEILNKHYEKLSKNQVDIKKINNRSYQGQIDCKEDNSYVMLTIPYEKGWTIKIDGKEAEYEEVLDSLIAINLDKGEHIIYLEYTPYGIWIGILSSVIGLLILTTTIAVSKKRKKREKL